MNTATPVDITAQVEAVYRKGEQILARLPGFSEADTQDYLIEPILETLGYPKANCRRQVADAGNFPDRIVWPVPVAEMDKDEPAARFIIEEKPLGTDFDKPGASRADTPARQIQRYLEQHRLADDATIGILTDGRVWRIYERHTGPDRRASARFVKEYSLEAPSFAGNLPGIHDWSEGAQALVARLSAATFVPDDPPESLFPKARGFLAEAVAAIRGQHPAAMLEAFFGQALGRLEIALPATGLIADARQHDWEPGFTVGLGPTYRPLGMVQESLLAPPRIRLAAIPFRGNEFVGGQHLRKGDIGLCARAFGHCDDPLLLCAYTQIRAGGDDERPNLRMRLALHFGGQTSMTPEFDPDMPPTSVFLTIDKILELLRGPDARRTPTAFQNAFDILPLQQDFYVRIEGWLKTKLKGERAGTHDMAMVRHLIRTLFAWILKEHGLVPRSLFDKAFVQHVFSRSSADSFLYHEEILDHLFHGALNVPLENRVPHRNAELRALFDNTPFLNGSIFARHPSDGTVRLPEADYWSDGTERNGLYDILSEFQWTLDEHSAQTNDQALDPELLGALFERLVSLVDHSQPPPRRKPKGTYYTPRDVVAVMVTDALVARMLREEDLALSEADLRRLFSAADDGIPDWPDPVRRQVYERLRRLTVFDPAVGSGVFLLATLETLMTAFAKLDMSSEFRANRGTLVRGIIRDQLHGGDIQPLAAQIAKLRLFLAIEAAEGMRTGPLPNLEARIVNADALGTVPDPDWRPGTAEQLLEADQEFQRLLSQIIANRSEWFEAHEPAIKERLMARDREFRVSFAERIGTTPVSGLYRSFVEWAPLEHDDSIADTDPRLMFSRDPWPGFDIVIGNPPYGNVSKTVAERARERNYRSARAGRVEALFVELALTLANPHRGVVELVLPLGVSFRQDHADLRSLAERRAMRIDLRHYDMTPGRIFNTEPTAKTWPNKQRAVLFTACRGEGGRVRTTGLRRWFEMTDRHERADCLANRHMIDAMEIVSASVDRRISQQWLRTPTPTTQDLVSTLLRQRCSVGDLASASSGQGLSLGLPHTAYQYVAALPAGTVSPRRETLLHFQTEEEMLLALVALNGHIFYGWWLITDDGFDVNLHTATIFGVPDTWLLQGPERESALALAAGLVAAIPGSITGKRNAKKQWRNVDFFSGVPDLIEDIDRLQIESLGLPSEPLLPELRVMRSSSSWHLS